jgi:hypothetical protein
VCSDCSTGSALRVPDVAGLEPVDWYGRDLTAPPTHHHEAGVDPEGWYGPSQAAHLPSPRLDGNVPTVHAVGPKRGLNCHAVRVPHGWAFGWAFGLASGVQRRIIGRVSRPFWARVPVPAAAKRVSGPEQAVHGNRRNAARQSRPQPLSCDDFSSPRPFALRDHRRVEPERCGNTGDDWGSDRWIG